MRKALFTFLMVASVLLATEQLALLQAVTTATCGCTTLGKNRDAQFITYEGMSTSKQEVMLRLHNNSTCNIEVETDPYHTNGHHPPSEWSSGKNRACFDLPRWIASISSFLSARQSKTESLCAGIRLGTCSLAI